MPLLEIVQTRQVNAYISLDETTAQQVDLYAAFLRASADEVIDKALTYVFSKDREFQEFLRAPGAAQPLERLRVHRRGTNGAESGTDRAGTKSREDREQANNGRLRS
jgi:hypothetical protein